MQHIQHVLPWSASGTQRTLSVFRFGSGPRKAYIQASLHADELPGMRVAVELKRRLRELEAQGRLNGVIELVPMANPIGIGQMFQATHQGRFEFNSGKNFNRDFPALADAVAERVADLDAGAHRLQETHHARVRGIGVLGSGKGCRFTAFGRRGWPVTADQADFGQVAEDLFGIQRAGIALGVEHASQFHSGCHTGQGNVGLRETFGQVQPWHRAGFIEGIAASVLGQQHRAWRPASVPVASSGAGRRAA